MGQKCLEIFLKFIHAPNFILTIYYFTASELAHLQTI